MGYTTALLVEAELRASQAFSSTTIPSLAQVTEWIKEESATIDYELGYSVAPTQYDEYYDVGEEDKFYTRVAPVISVDTLLYATSRVGSDDYATSWTTKSSDSDFYIKKDRGEIVPIHQKWSPATGDRRVRLIYTAGYLTTPLSVQKLATKKVALRTLNTIIYQNVSERNDGGSISVGSINIVEPDSYGVNSYKTLSQDVKVLQEKLTEGFGVHRYGSY